MVCGYPFNFCAFIRNIKYSEHHFNGFLVPGLCKLQRKMTVNIVVLLQLFASWILEPEIWWAGLTSCLDWESKVLCRHKPRGFDCRKQGFGYEGPSLLHFALCLA